MVRIIEPIQILGDREPVPPGRVTFGLLITEAREEKREERELDERTKWHHALHARYCRRYRIDLDLIAWERYVCRIEEEHAAWFAEISAVGRMDLCDDSRLSRRLGRLGRKKSSG